MTRIKHVHSSGRYSRSPESLRKVIDKYITVDKADLITVTEVSDKGRADALRGHTGFKAVTGNTNPRDDCGIVWSTAVFQLVDSFTFEITNKVYYTAGGRRTYPACAVVAVLRVIETGDIIVVSTAHHPPSVQGKGGFNRATVNRVVAWQDGIRGWRKTNNKTARRYKASAVLLTADWNMDIRQPWVQALIKTLFPKYSKVWKSFPKTGGTLGKRIIDFALVKGNLVRASGPHLLQDDNSSDHRPYAETFNLTP